MTSSWTLLEIPEFTIQTAIWCQYSGQAITTVMAAMVTSPHGVWLRHPGNQYYIVVKILVPYHRSPVFVSGPYPITISRHGWQILDGVTVMHASVALLSDIRHCLVELLARHVRHIWYPVQVNIDHWSQLQRVPEQPRNGQSIFA